MVFVVTFAGLVIVPEHADILVYQGKPVFILVMTARKLPREVPDSDFRKPGFAIRLTLLDQEYRLHCFQ
jgi:hypothetical protein